MSIEPLKREKIDQYKQPLPPCWLRKRQTHLNFPENLKNGLWQVGPNKQLHKRLIELITEAQEVIIGSTFLLSDSKIADALLSATDRGVRVYLLTASEHRVRAAPGSDDFFSEKMCNEHKDLLDSLAGKVLLRSAEHFHAKFLVSDPQGDTPRGIITTANFNPALVESVELGVELSREEVLELAGWFNRSFWLEAERELLEKGKLSAVSMPPSEPITPAQKYVVVTAKDQLSLQKTILSLVRNTKRSLLVASYGLEAGHAVIEAIAEKARSGIPVTIFTRPRPAVKDAVALLAKAGARIVAHDKLHAKAIVSDDEGLVMSANLQNDGLDQGFEVGVKLIGKRLTNLRQTLEGWLEEFPWQYASNALPQDHLGEICLVDKSIKDGKRWIVKEVACNLPSMISQDALAMHDTPDPKFTPPEFNKEYPQTIRYQWSVEPPRLGKNAKERKQDVERDVAGKDGVKKIIKNSVSFNPQVYDLNGKVYVVLKPGDNPETAKRRAAEMGARVVLP